MKVLVLEDNNERIKAFQQKLIGKEVVFCATSEECINVLTSSPTFDYITLDHDLGGQTYQPSGKGTGYEVAEWIVNNPDKKPNHILIHSLNNRGAAAMMLCFGRANINVSYIPFLWDKL